MRFVCDFCHDLTNIAAGSLESIAQSAASELQRTTTR